MKLETNSKWLLTCKEATYFSSLREDGLLPFWLRIRLAFHTFTCGPCKRFIAQTKALAQQLKSLPKQLLESSVNRFSEEEKSELQDQINKKLNN